MQIKHLPFLIILIIIGAGIFIISLFDRPAAPSSFDESSAYLQSLMSAPLKAGQYRSTNVDLDGDGRMEQLMMTIRGDEVTGYTTMIGVNDQLVEVPQFHNVQGYFGIVDINTTDEKKEIVISDLGPSTDNTTAFYAWQDDTLTYMGTTGDLWESMTFNGDGTFTSVQRAGVLDTWFYRARYRMNTQETVVIEQPQDFYERLSSFTPGEVMALKQIAFQTSPTDSTISMRLTKGARATVRGCDQVKMGENGGLGVAWCKIEDESTPAKVGWFKSDTIDTQNDLSGFSFAD